MRDDRTANGRCPWIPAFAGMTEMFNLDETHPAIRQEHRMDGPIYAGVELGGTKCICILARGPDDILAEQQVPTRDPATTLAAIEAVLDGWRDAPGFTALGLASFGPLELDPASPRFGVILATPKPGWTDVALHGRFAGRYAVPVGIDTDVAGAALAEGRWGGAQGLDTFAYVTVGTGVGVGVIVAGRPVRGIAHAEAGHMRVPRLAGDDWPGSCAFHGDCVEGLVAGSAIEARLDRRAGTLRPDDPVWRPVAHALTAMAHNLVMTAAPSRILIGGGVATKQPHLLPMIRAGLVESLAGFGAAARIAAEIERYIAAPALGTHAGPLGAIAIAIDAAAMPQAS